MNNTAQTKTLTTADDLDILLYDKTKHLVPELEAISEGLTASANDLEDLMDIIAAKMTNEETEKISEWGHTEIVRTGRYYELAARHDAISDELDEVTDAEIAIEKTLGHKYF